MIKNSFFNKNIMNIKENKKRLKPESVSRLVACQALYVYYNENNDNKNVNDILNSINEYYIKNNFTDEDGKNKYENICSSEFVLNIINGVIEHVEEFDNIINDFLDRNDTTGTLDEVLLQIFRLAIYELKFTKTDKNIIVNEYTDIVAEFYSGIYITFTNGILDNIGTYLVSGKRKEEPTKNKNIQSKLVLDKPKVARKVLFLHNKNNHDKDDNK